MQFWTQIINFIINFPMLALKDFIQKSAITRAIKFIPFKVFTNQFIEFFVAIPNRCIVRALKFEMKKSFYITTYL